MTKDEKKRGQHKKKISIKIKLVLVIVVTLIIIFGVQTHFYVQQGRADSEEEARQRGRSFADLSHQEIIKNYKLYGESGFYKFRETVNDITDLNQDLQRFRIVDMNGNILFDTRQLQDEKRQPDTKTIRDEGLLEKARGQEQALDAQEEKYTVIQPHVEEWGRHKYSIIYDFNYGSADKNLDKLAKITSKGAMLALILSSLLIILSSNALFTRPIDKLSKAMDEFKNGDLKRRVELHTRDELEKLGLTFNHMADTIQKSRKKLENYNKTLEKKVNERTDQLTQKVFELEKAENKIKESEKKFKSYISTSPEGIFLVNKEGKYIYVNEAACKMLGYTKKEILRMSLGDITPKKHKKESYESFKELKKTGKLDYEGPLKKKNGKVIQVRINGAAIPGQGYLGFVTDITKEKESEQKLLESEKKFKNLFENAQDAMFIHDFKPKFIEVNDLACKRLGYTRKELLKKGPQGIDAPEQAKKIKNTMKEIDEKGWAMFESVHVTKKGKHIPVHITAKKITYEGKKAIFSSARDIKEWKKIQKQQEERAKQLKKAKKDIESFNKQLEDKVEERTSELKKANEKVRDLLETKTQFVNQVAHDLRTPLTPISVLLPAVKKEAEGKLSDDELKKLDVVINNAKYLAQLVSDTLDIARLDAGKAEFTLDSLNLKKLVQEVIDNNQVVFDEKDVKVENHIKENLPPAKADKVKLIEVFENIIMNATKFMTEDEKKLTFKAEKGKQKITVNVSDTGIGIKKEDLKKIFDEFHKVDAARHEQSSGLGLAICKRIIKEFGGDIWAESDGPGKGATIAFTIPITDKQKEE